MVCTIMEVRAEIENALKAITAIPENDKIDWEWTPVIQEQLPDLEADLHAKIQDKTFAEKEEESGDEQDRRDRRRREGTQPPPVPGSSLGKGKDKAKTGTRKMSIGAGGNRPPSLPPTSGRNQGAGDPDSSDSDSGSSDKGAKGSRSLKTSEDKLLAALLRSLKREKPRPEAPKPKAYKGDPKDLERFIRSLDNVWAIEKRKYKDDLTKIRFTANLLERPTSSKYRDPVQWYEAYHPKIDLAAARQLPGGQRAVIDPI